MRSYGYGVREWLVISLLSTISLSDRILIRDSAGGQAINSKMQRMMEVVPESIHDRSGIFMGSYDEVQKVIDIHAKAANGTK